MNVLELLQELQDEFDGKKGVFSKKIDYEKCREIVSALCESLPSVFTRATEIIATRESILSNADLVANNVIKEAETRAINLASQSEIVKNAEKQRQVSLDKAYRECDLLVQKTKEHLDGMFRETEKFFTNMLELTRKNRNELRDAFTAKVQ